MRELSLRPYVGRVVLCASLQEFRALYAERTEHPYPYEDDPMGGRYIQHGKDWLVWAATTHALAHEFAHVLLHLCRDIGHDPTVGDGEPFCYMLSQLLLEALEP